MKKRALAVMFGCPSGICFGLYPFITHTSTNKRQQPGPSSRGVYKQPLRGQGVPPKTPDLEGPGS